jgi:FAD/FMN-containing dehydrogenase
VLIEPEGSDPAADERRFEAVIAKSEHAREALWTARDDVIRLTELRPMLIFDVSAPRIETERYVNEVQQAIARGWPQSRFFTFGHLADGNLHFAISRGGRRDRADAHAETRARPARHPQSGQGHRRLSGPPR